MKRSIVLLAAGMAGVLTGCSRSNNLLLGEVEAQVGAHRVRVTDCYRTDPPQPERLADLNGQAAYRYMPCKDAVVEIRGSELTVNGRPYGQLGPADPVLVDHGVVSVNPAEMRAKASK
jgi:hypothetical protein